MSERTTVESSPSCEVALATSRGVVSCEYRSGLDSRSICTASAEVRISVHDATGRRVRELDAGARGRGLHHAIWDGRDGSGRSVSSGIYFLRLEADAGSLIQKVVLRR